MKRTQRRDAGEEGDGGAARRKGRPRRPRDGEGLSDFDLTASAQYWEALCELIYNAGA
jgi:hypothetical protein